MNVGTASLHGAVAIEYTQSVTVTCLFAMLFADDVHMLDCNMIWHLMN